MVVSLRNLLVISSHDNQDGCEHHGNSNEDSEEELSDHKLSFSVGEILPLDVGGVISELDLDGVLTIELVVFGHLFPDVPTAVAEDSHAGPSPVVLVFFEHFVSLRNQVENHESFDRGVIAMFLANQKFWD